MMDAAQSNWTLNASGQEIGSQFDSGDRIATVVHMRLLCVQIAPAGLSASRSVEKTTLQPHGNKNITLQHPEMAEHIERALRYRIQVEQEFKPLVSRNT